MRDLEMKLQEMTIERDAAWAWAEGLETKLQMVPGPREWGVWSILPAARMLDGWVISHFTCINCGKSFGIRVKSAGDLLLDLVNMWVLQDSVFFQRKLPTGLSLVNQQWTSQAVHISGVVLVAVHNLRPVFLCVCVCAKFTLRTRSCVRSARHKFSEILDVDL